MNKLLFFVSLFNISICASAQKCLYSEDINPINDSLCWLVPTKSGMKFFIDKAVDKNLYANIEIITPEEMMSAKGDSGFIFLEDNKVIKLVNMLNYRSRSESINVFFDKISYHYTSFFTKINESDLVYLSLHQIKGYAFYLYSNSPSVGKTLVSKKDNPLIPRSTTYTHDNNTITINIKKIPKRQIKDILLSAGCAMKIVKQK